jgi:DNA-3-methyladenine glycosylase
MPERQEQAAEYKPLPRSFFEHDTTTVSKNLLGKTLLRRIDDKILAAKIVEVEAYLGEHDPAAHASFGNTNRTKVLYGEPGHAYVYRIHGWHCLNAVAEPLNSPGCVLIRAVEPIEGIEHMREYRKRKDIPDKQLANGPGKLCQALNIDLALYGADLTAINSPLSICEGDTMPFEIEVSKRIGITKAADWELRFTVKDNIFVSKTRNERK